MALTDKLQAEKAGLESYLDSVRGSKLEQNQLERLIALNRLLENINQSTIVNGTVASTQSGTWNLANITGTVSLPTGAATSANQATANTSLSSIDGKTPTLGQALASASVPVVLPASQITALTPLSTVGISSLPSLPAGSNTIGAISNSSFGISGTLPAFASTPTFNIGTAPNLTITNTSFTANAGTNLNTSALALESGGNLAGINSKLPALSNGKIPVEVGSLNVTVGNASLEIANDVGNPIPVSDAGGSITVDGSVSISNFPATQVVNTGLTQPLTDAQLRNTPISVIGTFWQTTQPISATALPLPSGAAIAAKQPALGIAGTASTDVITVQGIAGGVAQPVSIATLPALAAGTNAIGSITNTTFAATQSGAWNITNISGTISLPTGASTSALQTTGNIALSSIDIKTIPAFTNSPVNLGVVNQAVLKAGAGVVYKLYCYNKSTSVRFFQIHNKAAAPVNNDVPIESFPIAPNNALILDSTFWGASGRVCSVGVSWAFSSTEATLTLATAADQTSSVGYL